MPVMRYHIILYYEVDVCNFLHI